MPTAKPPADGFDRRYKAVLYPAGTVAGYGHAFSLGLAGVHVVALHPRRCATFASRFVAESHVVPDAAEAPERFIEWLGRYGREQRERPVLFMAEDLYAWLVSRHQDALAPFFQYPFVDPERLGVFFDKSRMYPAAAAAGLRVPETLVPPIQSAELAAWPHFPAVIKPVVSRFTPKPGGGIVSRPFPLAFGGKGLLARSPEELARLVQQVEQRGIPCCVQRFIPGGDGSRVSIRLVAAPSGRVPAAFAARKIRQHPAVFGTGVVRLSERRPDVQREAERFVAFTGYVGPALLDFKEHAGERLVYFIEINARLDFAVRMATLHGVNLPLQQYLLSTGQPLFSAEQRDDGRYWIDVPTDLRGCFTRLFSTDSADDRLGLADMLRPYRRFHEAVANLRDPIPSALRIAKLSVTLARDAANTLGRACWAGVRRPDL